VLKDIAFQCRCAISLREDTFYLKYLPEEPVALGTPQWGAAKNRVNDTITLSDIDAEQGVAVELTVTEDLVTKMKVNWRISNAPDNEYTPDKDRNQKCMILRHNITRYGVQEQDYDWYIFNQPDIILKCATFWLIRLSNTWKRVKFRTFLNKLNLETFDTVLFDDRVNGVGKGMAIRDAADDKPRPDLISPFAEERVGHWLRMGAAKYAERNWEHGMPFSRCIASLRRHLMRFQQGRRDEDHLAAIIFNAMAVIHYEEMIARGVLPAALNDMPAYAVLRKLRRARKTRRPAKKARRKTG
jgi:hypothetical protein